MLCFLVFVAGQNVADIGDGRLVVGASVAATGLAGAWALAEELGWQPIGVDAGSRLIGSMGSASFLGAAMALGLPMALGVALDPSWSRRQRRVAMACAGLAGVALVGSGARAAWGGVLVGAAVVAFVHRERIRAHARRAAAAAVLAVVVVVGLGVVTGVAGRVPQFFDHGGAGGNSRIAEWSVALGVLAHHPLTGVGPEGYRIALPDGLDAHYVETYGLSPLPDRAHDSLLDVAVTTGLLGAAAYAALLAVVAMVALRALRGGPPWMAGVAVGLIAYGAQELALFPVATLEPAAWLLAGLLLAQFRQVAPARGAAAHTSRPSRPGHGTARAGGDVQLTGRAGGEVQLPVPRLVAVVLAVAAVVAAVAGVRDVLADRAARASTAALARQDDPAARRLAHQAAGLRPDQIEYWLAAEQADAAPDTPSALTRGLSDLEKALGVSPSDPVVRDERGRLLLERALRSGSARDLAEARADNEQLVAANPYDAEDQLRLGVADAQAGDATGAQRAWLAADRLAPRSASAATDLAVLHAGQGRWAEAAAAARQALARDPGETQARGVLSESKAHLGT
ncbi:MAG: O-antigen ligase family protein [Acidimicrobiales bacterium]